MLPACSHLGLAEKSKGSYAKRRDHGIEPDTNYYGSMVDPLHETLLQFKLFPTNVVVDPSTYFQ